MSGERDNARNNECKRCHCGAKVKNVEIVTTTKLDHRKCTTNEGQKITGGREKKVSCQNTQCRHSGKHALPYRFCTEGS